MKLAQQIKKGIFKDKEKTKKPLTVKQIRRLNYQAEIAKFKKNISIHIQEHPSWNFFDIYINELYLNIQNEISEQNWRASFKDGHFYDFVDWLMKQGFKLDGIHRVNDRDKDPGEFSKIYYLRINW